jgi:hypothetical protein
LIERIKKHFSGLPPHQEAVKSKVIQDSIGRSIADADFPSNFPAVDAVRKNPDSSAPPCSRGRDGDFFIFSLEN